MSDKSGIEWTDATWNVVTGCTEVSPGCDNCYAKTFAERFRGTAGHHFERGFDLTLRPERLDLPLRWKKPRRIFVNSMSDLFHDDISDDYIARVFDVMMRAPQHTFQILTKRHGRMRSLLNRWAPITGTPPWVFSGPWPIPNVWLGVSAEDQKWAATRVHALLATPAAVRWVSAEPLLGPVDLRNLPVGGGRFLDALAGDVKTAKGEVYAACPSALDWVVVGGESGAGARPMLSNWASDLRQQCERTGVPFLFKQWGAWAPSPTANKVSVVDTEGHEWTARMFRGPKAATGRVLDGQTWDQYPERVS